MKKPVLIIMAAGMGSRYGGLKQIEPIDGEGHIIMDFSVYDAKQAGFEEVIFVIKRDIEKDFKETIGDRICDQIKVTYVYQDLFHIPEGYFVPEGRTKPWGTGHAILSCASVVDGSFVVINADDFYGSSAFRQIFDYLMANQDDQKYRFSMAGYLLKNTITENGYVSRGICTTDQDHFLIDIVERTHIEKKDGEIVYIEEGKPDTSLPAHSTVSMNFWGFSKQMMQELKIGFSDFLKKTLPEDPLKSEYFIPFAVNQLLEEEKATVLVLTSHDKWYGVTYQEDKKTVVEAVKELKKQGIYPDKLWK